MIRTLNIVGVDDDDLNLFILMKSIKSAGHNGIPFPHGDAAWEYLQANPTSVDMVILDKMMAQLNGLEVIRLMKEHPDLKNIPIIIQSGDAAPERIKEGLDVGADRYITKPFKPAELIDIIREEAGKRGWVKDPVN